MSEAQKLIGDKIRETFQPFISGLVSQIPNANPSSVEAAVDVVCNYVAADVDKALGGLTREAHDIIDPHWIDWRNRVTGTESRWVSGRTEAPHG
ncbi:MULTISPECIES: hypothetical protein [Mycobacteroides]|uniref:hypothetical protein n=1 Tax=Mycobacteroides TaxID=670516 RepID=UPI000ACB82DB|nr:MULTISPECIES: hypothetical protein [Mycobacteroides]MBF9523063.1 hypothetical protein [Mycobacteroides chelonae]